MKTYSKLTDEKLLKRADYSAKSLTCLAYLTGFVGTGILVALIVLQSKITGGILTLAAFCTLSVCLLGAGYGALSVAARRGNPNAVGTAIAIMVASMAFSIFARGAIAGAAGIKLTPNGAGLLWPCLILIALFRDRNILLELKNRGLWDQLYATAKPSTRHCVVGGVLLAAGVISIHAETMYSVVKQDRLQKEEVRVANTFLQLLKTEEKDFLFTFGAYMKKQEQAENDAMMGRLDALEKGLADAKRNASGHDKLIPVLNTYEKAVAAWRKGVMLLHEPSIDVAQLKKTLATGDKLKGIACQQFDVAYHSANPKVK